MRAPAKQAVLDAREAACAAEEVQALAAALVAKHQRPAAGALKSQGSRVRPLLLPGLLLLSPVWGTHKLIHTCRRGGPAQLASSIAGPLCMLADQEQAAGWCSVALVWRCTGLQ